MKEYLIKLEDYVAVKNSGEYAPIFYYIGTIYGELAGELRRQGIHYSDPIIVEYRKQANYYFRKAIELMDADEFLLLLVYTNYANNLDSCGRVIESLRLYRKALKINPLFGMAEGNYGRALNFLANMVNDGRQYTELHCYSYQAVKRALEINDPNMHVEAIDYFKRMINEYPEQTGLPRTVLEEKIEYPNATCKNTEENLYRVWCLKNHLFLNPLNEVIDSPGAFAHDPLTIIQYTEPIDHTDSVIGNKIEPPKFFAMLNQLKEEYVYARFLYYEGEKKTGEVHYADKGVKLSNGADYTNYSIRLEQLKSSFRILFSLFDKMAFFVNDFWNLGYSERQASADKVFRDDNYPKGNCALTAMWWVYVEFYEKFGNADKASEKELKDLRNALEHKFVKIHEYEWNKDFQMEADDFYHIDEETLRQSAFRLLQLTRECLMYLVYAVGIHESQHYSDNKELAVRMDIMDLDDNWKR